MSGLGRGTAVVLRWLSGPLGTILALVLVWGLFWVADYSMNRPYDMFCSWQNTRTMATQMSIVAVAALGMTMVIIAGGIDLSAGTALTLSATVLAYGLKHDVPPLAAVALCLLTGVACGAINGLLVSTLKIVPFIVTLGTMTIFLGVGKLISDETTIFPASEQIPSWLSDLCSLKPPATVAVGPLVLPTFPRAVWITAVLAVLVAALLRYTVLGRYVFALGSNEQTARLCGLNIPVLKVSVYALAGVFVGFAGMYQFGLLKMGNPVEGIGLELKVIAAVVIGGGSLQGGRGSVVGTLAGAAIMTVIASGCAQLELGNPTQDIIVGLIIVAAVVLDQFRGRLMAT